MAKIEESEENRHGIRYGYFRGTDGSLHYFPPDSKTLRDAARRGAEQASGQEERLSRRRAMMGQSRSGKSP